MEWKDKISTFKLIDVRGIQDNFFQRLKIKEGLDDFLPVRFLKKPCNFYVHGRQ